MVLVQNIYKNTLIGVLRTQITFVTYSSPSCYVTLRTQVIRLNSGNLGPQKTDSGVFTIVSIIYSLRYLAVDPLDVVHDLAEPHHHLCAVDVAEHRVVLTHLLGARQQMLPARVRRVSRPVLTSEGRTR